MLLGCGPFQTTAGTLCPGNFMPSIVALLPPAVGTLSRLKLVSTQVGTPYLHSENAVPSFKVRPSHFAFEPVPAHRITSINITPGLHFCHRPCPFGESAKSKKEHHSLFQGRLFPLLRYTFPTFAGPPYLDTLRFPVVAHWRLPRTHSPALSSP